MMWSAAADTGTNNLRWPAGSRTQYVALTGAETGTGQLAKHSGQNIADQIRVTLNWPHSNAITKTVIPSLLFTASLFPGQQFTQTRVRLK
jgi:hypothetical protein